MFISYILDASEICQLVLKGGRALQYFYPSPSNDFDYTILLPDGSIYTEKQIAYEISMLIMSIINNNNRGIGLSCAYYKDENDFRSVTSITSNSDKEHFFSLPITSKTILKLSFVLMLGSKRIYIPIIDFGCGFKHFDTYLVANVYDKVHPFFSGGLEPYYEGCLFSLISIDLEELLNERVYYFITITLLYNDFQTRLFAMDPGSPEYLEEMNNFTDFWKKNQFFYGKLPNSIVTIATKMPDDKKGQLLAETIHNIFGLLQYQGKIIPGEFVNPGYFLHVLHVLLAQ
jgi:hypothetical protein